MGKALEVRKPPIHAVMAQHLPQERGKCRWCGKPTTSRTGHHKQLRWWHDECEALVQALARPEIMRDMVFRRDKGICANCEEDWSQRFRLIPEYVPKWRQERDAESDYATTGPDGKRLVVQQWITEYRGRRPTPEGFMGRFPYVPLVAVSLWHVEHRVPLWKVRHLPPLERIAYFLLDALETWCEPCHKVKTRKEAAEKAHYDRISAEPVVTEAKVPKRKWPKRKLRSNSQWSTKKQKIPSRPLRTKSKRKSRKAMPSSSGRR